MNAVQCDYCGKFAANPTNAGELIGRYTGKLPDDWWHVGAFQGRPGYMEPRLRARTEDHGEFCSRDCISRHFAKPAPEETSKDVDARSVYA